MRSQKRRRPRWGNREGRGCARPDADGEKTLAGEGTLGDGDNGMEGPGDGQRLGVRNGLGAMEEHNNTGSYSVNKQC